MLNSTPHRSRQRWTSLCCGRLRKRSAIRLWMALCLISKSMKRSPVLTRWIGPSRTSIGWSETSTLIWTTFSDRRPAKHLRMPTSKKMENLNTRLRITCLFRTRFNWPSTFKNAKIFVRKMSNQLLKYSEIKRMRSKTLNWTCY